MPTPIRHGIGRMALVSPPGPPTSPELDELDELLPDFCGVSHPLPHPHFPHDAVAVTLRYMTELPKVVINEEVTSTFEVEGEPKASLWFGSGGGGGGWWWWLRGW